MPRTARIKNNESIVYIVVRGISDVSLFRDDEDKKEYLSYLSYNRNIYGFKLYAYCVMQDFAHFIIDLCGSDISNIMSSINGAYSRRYNIKYDRNGHVFNDRFRSKIIIDELELKAISLYVHNSPVKLKEYEKHPEDYPYSSLNAYLGHSDPFNIIDRGFIREFAGESPEDIENYYKLVPNYNTERLLKEVEFYSKTSNSKYYTKKEIPEISPEEILNFISGFTGISKIRLYSKYIRDSRDARAVTAFIMKNYCNFKTNRICSVLGDICPANAAKLFNLGLELIEKEESYKNILDELKKKFAI